MNKIMNQDRTGNFVKSIKWCHYIVNIGYATVVIITLAHIVLYLTERKDLTDSAEIYLRNYVIISSIGLFALNLAADFLIRYPRLPLVSKQYISLILFLFFSFYLCLTHEMATVLLGTFGLSVFASTVFSNVNLTWRIFIISNLALLVSGVKIYIEDNFNRGMLVETFIAWDMLLCSYLIARILIQYGQDNLMSLMQLYYHHQSLQEQLKLDPFTVLYNKKTFEEYLPIVMEECMNTDTCISLAVIDLDHFKRVNDVYGHVTGDRVLLHLSQILKSNETENINVFRIGGEEFAILFKGYCVKDAYKICDNMRSIMAATSLHTIRKRKVTFSCGLACMDQGYDEPLELVKAADSALYKAKSSGRNKVVILNDPKHCEKKDVRLKSKIKT